MDSERHDFASFVREVSVLVAIILKAISCTSSDLVHKATFIMYNILSAPKEFGKYLLSLPYYVHVILSF